MGADFLMPKSGHRREKQPLLGPDSRKKGHLYDFWENVLKKGKKVQNIWNFAKNGYTKFQNIVKKGVLNLHAWNSLNKPCKLWNQIK